MRFRVPEIIAPARWIAAVCTALIPLSVLADGAADAASTPASPPYAEAKRSFAQFGARWMQSLRAAQADARALIRVREGPDAPVFTYRGYGDEFEIELQPTGSAAAPFVGLLHYTENLYSCVDLQATECRIATTTPVTEVFRFLNGRWGY